MNIRADGTNIMEIEMNEGEEKTNYDYRKNVAKPWPPNYALAPIFMIASLDTTIIKSCDGKVIAKEGADGLLGGVSYGAITL